MKSGILSSIGQTPLRGLELLFPDYPMRLYAKLEMFNPGGSIKDRPALQMVVQAIEDGDLKPGATVVESSSGNMAIGLAQVCSYYGLNLVVVVDPKINSHTLKILNTYGAKVEQVTTPDQNGNYLDARIQRVKGLVNKISGAYWPNQYENPANPAAHHQTMQEIVGALSEPPDYLFVATSTCGTVMGCADYVQRQQLDTKIIAVDAEGSVLFGQPPADRLVPGHGAGRPSALLDEGKIDHVIHISDAKCIRGCHRLLKREAILAGGSSGAVVAAIPKLRDIIPAQSSCVMIFPDSGERYLDTIYNHDWLHQHFESENFDDLEHCVPKAHSLEDPIGASFAETSRHSAKVMGVKRKRRIAIIGAGPKGTYGFERLAAEFMADSCEPDVEIHVFNKNSHFGAGQVYHPSQPDFLLMNNHSADINMWSLEEPSPAALNPLTLPEWIKENKQPAVSEQEYVPRSIVGEYLRAGFEAIANNLPPGVSGHYVVGEVVAVAQKNGEYELKLKPPGGALTTLPDRYDFVLLATGHPSNKLSAQDEGFKQFALQHRHIGFIPSIYPVELLGDVPSKSRVAIRGMGLTFIDAVLALTEGRGGKFKSDETNEALIYEPSGREPSVIHPFSRSGMPMVPRRPAAVNPAPLKFFTEDHLHQLKNESPNGKLDFTNQLLPLLYREMNYAYYEVELRQAGFEKNLKSYNSYAEIQQVIEAYHKGHPDARRFNAAAFLNAEDNLFQFSDVNHHHRIKKYLKFFISEAKKGERNSSWAAVTSVWRKITPVFGKFYAFGGLKPESQRYFDMSFRRLLNRVTFGPPVENMEKVMALINAGIVDFGLAQHPELTMDKEDKKFKLKSADESKIVAIDVLINARISKVNVPIDQSPLYQNLIKNGLACLYENREEHETYHPGCIALTENGYVVDANGNANATLAVTGTPTEGVTFDNDALSRMRNNFVSEWAAYVQKACGESEITLPVS